MCRLAVLAIGSSSTRIVNGVRTACVFNVLVVFALSGVISVLRFESEGRQTKYFIGLEQCLMRVFARFISG